LTRRWTFRGGPAREDIFRTFMTGLNGTPMPSFLNSVKEEDRWPLVDYVYSLSSGDDPGYASMVTADSIPGKMESGNDSDWFAHAVPALFPVVGQVVEGRRGFFPSANAVEVRAVYDSADIAIMVSWHDMSAERSGANRPTDPPGSGEDSLPSSPGSGISDAVAVQIPLKQGEGSAKPYFLFGDKRNPAEIWFADLAQSGCRTFVGKGRESLSPAEIGIGSRAEYSDGEWRVVFVRPRRPAKGLALESGAFLPIAFSTWDGLGGETGSRRGATAWYTLYLKPPREGSPFVSAAARALAAFLIGWAAVYAARRRVAKNDQ
jgi:hypothetical protein